MSHRFIGRFEYSVDAKGRVNIPARFRKALTPSAAETFVICLAPDNRLRAYPSDVWTAIEARYAKLPSTPQNTQFLRALYQSIEEVELDGQGRIKLAQHLCDYAGITNKVALIGFSSEQCIELCAPEQLVDSSEYDFSDLFYQAHAEGGSHE